MTPVFADSSFYIALLNPTDEDHAVAVETMRQLHRPVITTE